MKPGLGCSVLVHYPGSFGVQVEPRTVPMLAGGASRCPCDSEIKLSEGVTDGSNRVLFHVLVPT